MIEEDQIEAPIKVLVERNVRKGWILITAVGESASVSITFACNTPERVCAQTTSNDLAFS